MLDAVQEIIELIEERKIYVEARPKRRQYLKGKDLDDYILAEFRKDIENSFSITTINHLIRIRDSETKDSKHFEKIEYVIKAQYKNIVRKHPEIFRELLMPVMKESEIAEFINKDLEELYYKSVVSFLDEWEEEYKKSE